VDEALAEDLRDVVDRVHGEDDEDDDQAGLVEGIGAQPVGQEEADAPRADDPQDRGESTSRLIIRRSVDCPAPDRPMMPTI
jgi:hypothetical protein